MSDWRPPGCYEPHPSIVRVLRRVRDWQAEWNEQHPAAPTPLHVDGLIGYHTWECRDARLVELAKLLAAEIETAGLADLWQGRILRRLLAGDDGAAVPILSMRDRAPQPLPNEDLIDWITSRSGNEG
jgi:hypothetical protein